MFNMLTHNDKQLKQLSNCAQASPPPNPHPLFNLVRMIQFSFRKFLDSNFHSKQNITTTTKKTVWKENYSALLARVRQGCCRTQSIAQFNICTLTKLKLLLLKLHNIPTSMVKVIHGSFSQINIQLNFLYDYYWLMTMSWEKL